MLSKYLLIFCVLFFATSLVQSEEITSKKDLSYADKSPANRLDVYAKAGSKNLPVMIWIHGGGWRIGDKSHVNQKPEYFLKQGFVFVSINYRMIDETDIPGMAADCGKAVKWVYDNIEQYGGNKEKLFLIGHSAGAHLAALISTDQKYLEQAGLKLNNIKGTILLDGAGYDVPRQIESSPLRSLEQTYIKAFTNDKEKQAAASPINHVAKDKNIPPFLICHCASRKDSGSQSEALAKKLNDAGSKTKVYPAEDKTHATINRQIGEPNDPPTLEIEKFLSPLK